MGKQTITRYVELSTMPLFVRAGTILPLDPVRQYVDEPSVEPTTLRIYSGTDGEYKLYEDDGISLDYQDNGANWTQLCWNEKDKTFIIEPDTISTLSSTGPRTFKV